MPIIKKARYTNKINKYNYSELICTFDNGEEKIFHFHASNPMPKIYVVEGLTWDKLVGVCIGMWRMAVGEFVKVSDINKAE